MISFAESHPDNLEAQRAVLESDLAWGDTALMARVIERVRQLTSEDALEWRLAKVRMLIHQAPRPERALESAQELLNFVMTAAPSSVDAHVLQAEVYEAKPDLDAALREWSSASALAPGAQSIVMGRARVQRAKGDVNAAKETLAWIARHPPAFRRERLRLAALLADCEQVDRAIEIVEPLRLTASDSDEEECGLLLADLYRRARRFDDAERVCRQLLHNPTPPVIVFTAKLLAFVGKDEQSRKVLEMLGGLGLSADQRELAMAEHELHLNGEQAAIPFYRAACDAVPNSAPAWKGLIACYIAMGRVSDAMAAAATASAKVPTDATLRLLHSDPGILSAATEPDLRSLIQSVIQDPREDGPALLALRVVTAAGSSREVIATRLGELAEQFPQCLPVQFMSMRYDLAAENFGHVVVTADRTARVFPLVPDACRWQFVAHAASGQWSEALSGVDQWQLRLGNNPSDRSSLYEVHLARAQCLKSLERPTEAVAELDPFAQRVLASPGANIPWIRLYVASSLAMNDKDGLAKLCDRLQPMLQLPEGREACIRVTGDIADPDAAARWLSAVASAVPVDDTTQRVGLSEEWHRLSSRHPNIDCLTQERAVLAPLVDRAEPAPRAIFALAGFEGQENDAAAAETAYRRLLKLTTGDDIALIRPFAANNLASLIVHRAATDLELTEALALANDAVRAKPDDASFHDTRASVYLARKQFGLAASELEQAVQLKPSLKYRVRLANATANSGNRDLALRMARQLESDVNGNGPSEEALPELDRRQFESLIRKLDSAPAGAKTAVIQ
jgi:tetratricopeptide (TPR) repeat protein